MSGTENLYLREQLPGMARKTRRGRLKCTTLKGTQATGRRKNWSERPEDGRGGATKAGEQREAGRGGPSGGKEMDLREEQSEAVPGRTNNAKSRTLG